MIRIIPACLTLLLLLTFSCRLEYNQDDEKAEIPETIPDSILFNFEHISVSKGKPVFRIQAEKAKSYENQKKTILENVTFIEFDDQLEAATSGTADHAVLFTESDNAELTGNIEAWSSREEAFIKTDYLYWNNETRILDSKPEEVVTVTQESGTEITGSGFRADMRTMTVTFEKGASGTFVSTEEDE